MQIKVADIICGYNPRQMFDKEKMEELKKSMQEGGNFDIAKTISYIKTSVVKR